MQLIQHPATCPLAAGGQRHGRNALARGQLAHRTRTTGKYNNINSATTIRLQTTRTASSCTCVSTHLAEAGTGPPGPGSTQATQPADPSHPGREEAKHRPGLSVPGLCRGRAPPRPIWDEGRPGWCLPASHQRGGATAGPPAVPASSTNGGTCGGGSRLASVSTRAPSGAMPGNRRRPGTAPHDTPGHPASRWCPRSCTRLAGPCRARHPRGGLRPAL